MEKRKPSFILILAQTISEQIVLLLFSLISGGFGVSKSYGESIKMFESVPLPVWYGIFIVGIVFIFSKALLTYRKELESYNSKSNETTNESTKMANSSDRSVSLIDSSVTNSFNNNLHVPTPGYENPTRSELIRKIGVEIQEFEEQFDRIRYKQLKNRHDEIVKATDIFKKIRTGALRHANIELQGTALLTLFKNLEKELNKYPVQVGMALQYEEERTFYAQADKASLPLIIEKINQVRSEMEKTELNINMAILLIKKFVNEYRG